jgi:nicotinamide riboside kinase
MHNRFEEKLREHNKKFIIVTGTKEERLKLAVAAIEQVLRK